MTNTTLGAIADVGTIIQNDILGSVVLWGIVLILLFVGLILIAKMNLKVGLALILPVVLAILGASGVSSPLIGGAQYAWISVMFIIILGIGGSAFVWWKISGQ